MIEKFGGFLYRQFFLVEETRRNQKDIEGLRVDVRRLEIQVEKLAAEIAITKATERLEREKMAQRHEHEIEKLMLQFNNALMQFEHRLTPPK